MSIARVTAGLQLSSSAGGAGRKVYSHSPPAMQRDCWLLQAASLLHVARSATPAFHIASA
jgi:hypothetical protein